MSKWHNGPNGPGICRATKGNCPFGGADSHFDSKEQAAEVYENKNAEEFGVLPGMKKNEDTRETKITASNSSGVAVSTSNFVVMSGKGTKHDTEYLHNKLKEHNMDSKSMVDSLNNDKNIHGKWSVNKESDDKIQLASKDPFGNTSYLSVAKVDPKPKKSQAGKITAGNSNGMAMSLSNYVRNGPGGTKESKEYFNNKIKSADYDSAKMVRFLNADKRISGKWSLDKEDDSIIRLKNEDVFGNDSYISVTKK